MIFCFFAMHAPGKRTLNFVQDSFLDINLRFNGSALAIFENKYAYVAFMVVYVAFMVT